MTKTARRKKSPRVREGKNTDDGWERQFVASEPRLSEAVEMYESLGFEVRLVPVEKGSGNCECNACLDPEKDRIIYTRVKKTGV